MSRVRVPRALVALIATAIVALPAAFALAYTYRLDNNTPPRVKHLHTGTYEVFNAIDGTSEMTAKADNVITDWRDVLAARETVVMRKTTTIGDAEVKLMDSDLVDTGADVVWSETRHQNLLAPPDNLVKVTFDESKETAWNANWKKHKVCNALGGTLGLEDTTESGDCMQQGINTPYIAGAGADKVDGYYGPNPLLGPLYTHRDNIKTTGSYSLPTAEGHAIQSVTVELDGNQISGSRTPCDDKCSVAPDPSTISGLSAGTHTVTATATNGFGQSSSNSFTLTAAKPTPDWGFNEDWAENPWALNPSEVPTEIAKTGLGPDGIAATTNRLVVRWSEAESTHTMGDPHQYNWSSVAPAYNAMLSAGQTPVLTLMSAPDWARDSDPCTLEFCTYPPASGVHTDVDWKEFVHQAILQFPQVMAVEVWNEPNLKQFWFPSPNAVRYAAVLHAARQGVDQAKAELAARVPPVQFTAPVITGGLSPGGTIGQATFLTTLYQQAGAAADFDGIGEHVYPTGSTENDWVIGEKNTIQQLRDVRDSPNINDQATPLWVTEVGVSTSPTGFGVAPDERVAESEQGRRLVALYDNVEKNLSGVNLNDVKVFLIHSYRDSVSPATVDRYKHMGVVNLDLTPKLAKSYLGCELGGRGC